MIVSVIFAGFRINLVGHPCNWQAGSLFPVRRSRIEAFHEGLIAVWRESCRHDEISDSTQTIAKMLAEHLPLSLVVVRRLNPVQHSLETIAAATKSGKAMDTPIQSTFAPSTWKRLLKWMKSGEIWHRSKSSSSTREFELISDEVPGDILAGPLINTDGLAGVLVFVAEAPHKFAAKHEVMVRQLLEPFSAALEIDRRLHELIALREAAEADRRSLLNRLGRQDVNEAIIGSETGLRHVMERVGLIAQSDVPVLILGETGTGKEVVSRAIHSRSKRGSGPFIRVNCGAIPPELIDSHLFGHEKGSFTGAAEQRKGWFERADGGTLFLDEIGELPLPAQVRLLRVMQDHQVERVGGQQTVHVDVRIVAATHRDLASMAKAGTFREDLWYRINVFPILLPRLRERIEDIPALARHFAERASERFGLPLVQPTHTELQILRSYHWPGNIRELAAVIDRAVLLGHGRSLEVAQSLGSEQSYPPSPPPDAKERKNEKSLARTISDAGFVRMRHTKREVSDRARSIS
jgi:transcriptional regulator with GAF, ATPase, and Fis domain